MRRYFFLFAMLLQTSEALGQAELPIPLKLQNFIKDLESQKNELQGGAIAILHKGKVIYKTTFGYRKGNEGPVTEKTLFPLASVSKSVSATALALMAESGEIDLEKKYKLPGLKPGINLKHILSHTTGYLLRGDEEIEKGLSYQELLKVLKHQKSKCKPGECYLYSNAAFILLGDILNNEGLSFALAIQNLRHSLNTDGLKLLPLDSSKEIAHPHGETKNKKGAKLKPRPFESLYAKSVPAAAGIYGSIDGLIEFFKLSFGYRPDLISPKTLKQFQAPFIAARDIDNWFGLSWPCPKKDIDSYYGLGWRILRAKKNPGKELIFHSGLLSGVVAYIGFIPTEETGIIILLNQTSKFAINKGNQLWGILLGKV